MNKMVSAYVLVIVKPGEETQVMNKLVKMKEVKDISTVYGEYDIIMKVETESMDRLQSLILDLRKDKAIERTSTMISIK